ncbi:hypothetical protein ACIGW0_08500 [Streptomyces bikiniensis]|uniref:Uncharacterized protein n=1 Tax=Streptomyces bikiniensis TaxID=1896 RepID=A0ABW8CQK1_STRBI
MSIEEHAVADVPATADDLDENLNRLAAGSWRPSPGPRPSGCGG